jgi:hypothetical protein
MEYQEVFEGLKERALLFHKTLVNKSVYQKQLSENDFLTLIEERLIDSADIIASGSSDPWVNVLGFCEGLLFKIKDYVFTSWFDAMEGPEEHLGSLKELLGQAGYQFSWNVDLDEKVVHFKVEDVEWDGPYHDFWWGTEPPFSTETPNLMDFLDSEDWFLYPVGTGDATGTYLLIPMSAKEPLKKFLVPGFSQAHEEFDPRITWLYEGVPENQRPDNLWEI